MSESVDAATLQPTSTLTTGYKDPIPGIIPFGSLTVLVGATAVGKTAMIAEWCERWRRGKSIWGFPTNPPTQFAYVGVDRPWANSHAYWFDRVGFSEIPHYSMVDDRDIKPDDFRDGTKALDLFKRVLDRAADGYPPIPGAHVIVDPAFPVFIAGNHNAPREVIYSLLSMARIAQDRQINLTLIGHFGKQKGEGAKDRYTRPQDRIAGSYAFSGYSDTQIFLLEPEGEWPWYTCGIVPRKQREVFIRCQKNDMGLFVPYDDLQENKSESEIWDCINENKPTKIGDIKELALQKGHSSATVERAVAKLVKDRRVIRIGRGRYQRVKIH